MESNNPPDDFMGSEILGRFEFLAALRRRLPPFWIAIHEFWRAKDVDGLKRWMKTNGIVDPWFEAVVWDTLGYWTQNPDSPSTRLAEGYRWFYYGELARGDLKVRLFCPTFNHPTLKCTISEPFATMAMMMNASPEEHAAVIDLLTVESVDDFEARMRNEFETQLRDYTGWLRLVLGENLSSLQTHAEWTAFAFCGLSYTKIGENWPGLARAKGCYQPDKTVSMAVARFVQRIGLTIPKRRKQR